MNNAQHYDDFKAFLKQQKMSSILEAMGFENGKDFFILDENEQFLSYDDNCLRRNKELSAEINAQIKSSAKKISQMDETEKYFYLNRHQYERAQIEPQSMADIMRFSTLYGADYRKGKMDTEPANNVYNSNNGILAIINYSQNRTTEMIISKNLDIEKILSDSIFGGIIKKGEFHVPMSNGESFLDEDKEKKWMKHKIETSQYKTSKENKLKAQRYLKIFPSQNYLTEYQVADRFEMKQQNKRIKKLENLFKNYLSQQKAASRAYFNSNERY